MREKYPSTSKYGRHGSDGYRKAELPVPTSALPGTPEKVAALEALDGKAMRTDALAAAVGDRSRLFKAGGLEELQQQGLVKHHKRLGFYRPDALPPRLADLEG